MCAVLPREFLDVKKTEDRHFNLESIYSCKIRLPQNETVGGLCAKERQQFVQRQRGWWKLTSPKKPTDPNPNFELLTPGLNQSQLAVAAKAKFDPLDQTWFSLYFTAVGVINKTADSLINGGFLRKPMTSYDEYKQFYSNMKMALKVSSIKFVETNFRINLRINFW